jgi:hypothetical protein
VISRHVAARAGWNLLSSAAEGVPPAQETFYGLERLGLWSEPAGGGGHAEGLDACVAGVPGSSSPTLRRATQLL